MKKITALLLAAILAISFAACTGDGNVSDTTPTTNTDTATEGLTTAAGGTFELALITDLGTIDDKSFNQGAWEGLKKYGEENNKTFQYYKPTEQSDNAYLDAIGLAVQGGAKIVVTPGYLFEVPVHTAQTQYPEVTFILLDGDPRPAGEGTAADIASNAIGVHYAEDQAGYLAGYAAIKDGYRKLGFMGGIAVPAVVSFGYGFIQGADAAAAELNLAKDEVTVKYNYTGTFTASPDIQTQASAWYQEGVEVIFACGGGIGSSIMSAAETAGKKVIGVDVDQEAESETVITSAMKELGQSVYDLVAKFYDGTFKGGESVILAAEQNGIGLPMATSRFKTFSQADYDAIFAKLKNKEVTLVTERNETGSPTIITTELVKIDEVVS